MGAWSSSVKKSNVGRLYCYTVILDAGHLYRFEGKDIGTFTIRGGSCGKFTVENNGPGEECSATIFDELGNIVFSEGHCFGDSVTIMDNPKDITSSVIYTRFGKCELEHPIKIRARPNETIHLKGKRNFIILGSGAKLEYSGSGNVFVNGSVLGITQTGSGKVRIRGSVKGDVLLQNGEGTEGSRLFINRNVTGNVVQQGLSLIQVEGNLYGNIEQDGQGEIRVWGKHRGSLTKNGNGLVIIDEEEIGQGDDEDKNSVATLAV